MMVVPVSWIPYLLVVGGVYLLFGEGSFWGLIVAAIGGFWVYLRHSAK